MAAAKFDCTKCVAICCSIYEEVEVTPRDVKRLALHFGVGVGVARRRYTKKIGRVRMLRRQRDPILEESCAFLDLEARVCSVYAARPEVCRNWPEHGRGCVYYDLLEFERKQQGDDRIVALIQIRPLEKRAR